jgi:hypothetical protein
MSAYRLVDLLNQTFSMYRKGLHQVCLCKAEQTGMDDGILIQHEIVFQPSLEHFAHP